MDDTRHPNNFPPLTIEQIRELAHAIREVFGSNLPRMDFTDKLLLFLEDAPGYETDAVGTSLIDSAWAGRQALVTHDEGGRKSLAFGAISSSPSVCPSTDTNLRKKCPISVGLVRETHGRIVCSIETRRVDSLAKKN